MCGYELSPDDRSFILGMTIPVRPSDERHEHAVAKTLPVIEGLHDNLGVKERVRVLDSDIERGRREAMVARGNVFDHEILNQNSIKKTAHHSHYRKILAAA